MRREGLIIQAFRDESHTRHLYTATADGWAEERFLGHFLVRASALDLSTHKTTYSISDFYCWESELIPVN